MLLIAIDFIIITCIFINMQLQSNCKYIVNNVNIQFKNQNQKEIINND